MKKALIVGINKYPSAPLYGCVKDATAVAEMLEKNGNGSLNFEARLYHDIPSKSKLTELIVDLFRTDNEISLFYFSGHGTVNNLDTYLVTPDYQPFDPGISVSILLKIANESPCRNRIIILDCCNAGAFGNAGLIGGEVALINRGITILAASRSDESALEVNGRGVFTNLLIEALKGGAADISGNITPGGVYAYIDQALGAHDQRPVFKTNITEFTQLRTVMPQVSVETLRKIAEYFPQPQAEFALDPSYEETNSDDIPHSVIYPYANPDNVAIFKDLQKYQSVGLVVPVGAPYMYYAAMRSKSCRLTPLGYHYWRLAKENRIR